MQHGSLTVERWLRFPVDQQLLMIANEMNRGARLQKPPDRQRLNATYERTLRLVDLTVEARPRPGLCRELLRWRDLVARLYISPDADPGQHRRVLRVLLQLLPATARQIPHLEAARG